MTPLSPDEIRTIANREGVNTNAVERFLRDMKPEVSLEDHLKSLAYEIKIYHYNKQTKAAMRNGIMLAYRLRGDVQ